MSGPRPPAANPFTVLGLPADPGLTDDDVRAAWRRIAAATHPDRADGGDPARFALAAAAYTDLRTRSGRGEAMAALAGQDAPPDERPGNPDAAKTARTARWSCGFAVRIRAGRPARLALRAAAALTAAAAGYAAASGGPAGPALAAGALTWLLLTGRRDLGPP